MGQGIKVYRSSAGGVLPSGLIALWSGSKDAVPDGWALCDGSNGTPDLRDRFVVGAGSSYAVGATGGENTHTLTVDEIPSHTHDVTMKESKTYNRGEGPDYDDSTYGYQNVYKETSSTGGSAAHENRPPYYALCFIMKL